MKAEDLYEGIGELDEETLELSEQGRQEKKAINEIADAIKTETEKQGMQGAKRISGFARMIGSGILAAAVLALIIGSVFYLTKGTTGTKAYAIAKAEYPEYVENPRGKEWHSAKARNEAYQKWEEFLRKNQLEEGYEIGVEPYLERSMQVFLGEAGQQNLAFSPLNVYMALAMLSETADGETRAQLLAVLGQDDLLSLRKQAQSIWKANYRKEAGATSIMASSLWLNEGIPYERSTLERVKEHYFASSFQGRMGDQAYDKAYRDWLNEQTGGLLSEQLSDAHFEPSTETQKSIMTLVTTVYFKANWAKKFLEANTKPDIFHAASGDRECDFMHSTESVYYWGEHFGAVALPLQQGDLWMWIILPDEDSGVEEVLREDVHDMMEVMGSLYGKYDYANQKQLDVILSLPKFDVSSRLELTNGLQKLGVKDAFEQGQADFSPLLKDDLSKEWGVFVSKAQHDARVCIDEEGVTAAAVTQIAMNGTGMPMQNQEEIIFKVDRPFLFVIAGNQGLPLFAGVVNEP